MSRSSILTGSQVALYVNGQLYGRVSSFSFSSDTPRRKLYAVDSASPFELMTTIHGITGSLGIYRLSGDGAAEGPGMVAPVSALTREKYFSMVLVDLTNSAIIFEAGQCSVESQSWTYAARDLVRGTVNFSALTYTNEVRKLG